MTSFIPLMLVLMISGIQAANSTTEACRNVVYHVQNMSQVSLVQFSYSRNIKKHPVSLTMVKKKQIE